MMAVKALNKGQAVVYRCPGVDCSFLISDVPTMSAEGRAQGRLPEPLTLICSYLHVPRHNPQSARRRCGRRSHPTLLAA